jgi:N-acetylmuramoyl-L-alanine amidase
MWIIDRPSPNFNARRNGALPRLVVLHHTAMRTCAAASDRLCDPAAEVSSHYLVGEDGAVIRLVPEEMRAWHAGAGAWGSIGDVNSASIGIELANPGPLAGFPPFPAPQMRALEDLLARVMARWSIPPRGVIAHSDMAPGRKADPGPKFDWRGLARLGLSVWPDADAGAGAGAGPGAEGWAAFRSAALAFGYRPPGVDGWPAVLAAFRLRFRPRGRGAEPDGADVAAITALAARHPFVDPGPAGG